MTHEHLGLEALDRLKRNADHDDDGRAADREAAVLDHDTDDDRQDRNDRQIQSAEERDFVDNLQDEVGSRLVRVMKSLVGLPGRKPGMKPPFFLRLLAISMGLNWIVA